MFFYYERLSRTQQGLVGLIFGLVLLLYALGVFEKLLGAIVILTALLLIFTGLVQSGLYDKIMALIKKEKKHRP
jgi:hypothetical protein